jgi:trk system potassium uptake protein
MRMRIIVIGGDETVHYLARQLIEKGHHVTIINRSVTHSQELFAQTNATVIHGDGSDVRILEEAGARQADILLALTPHDQDNLVACQIASKVFDLPRTIALVNDPENEELFRVLGVTDAFSSTHIIAGLIEQHAHFDDIKRLIPIGEGQVELTDIQLEPTSPAVGKTLVELGLSNNTLIACIVRGNEVIIPRGGNVLQSGDHILAISKHGTNEADLLLLIGD